MQLCTYVDRPTIMLRKRLDNESLVCLDKGSRAVFAQPFNLTQGKRDTIFFFEQNSI